MPEATDIRAPVGQRVRYLELVAEPVDELPQLFQRHIVTPLGAQEIGLNEFRPCNVARTCELYAVHRTVARQAALQPHQYSVDGATGSNPAATTWLYISRSRMVTPTRLV